MLWQSKMMLHTLAVAFAATQAVAQSNPSNPSNAAKDYKRKSDNPARMWCGFPRPNRWWSACSLWPKSRRRTS